MTPKATIKAGVIGLGVGRKHLDVYLSHPAVAACVVADLNAAKLTEAVNASPKVQRAESAEQILNDPTVNIVSVASYDEAHAEQVLRAIAAGKHVFVEKPLCLLASDATAIRRALRENPSVRLSSNLPLRACPRFQELRDEIRAGRMGDIYSVRADYLWGRPDKLLAGWRADMPFYSLIYGASVHMIDLVIWMLGCRPVEVRASGNKIATRGTRYRFNDFVSIQMVFDNGIIVESSAHGAGIHPHFHRLEVYGTKKTFQQGLGGAFWIASNDEKAPRLPVAGDYPAKETRGKVLESFLDSIIGKVQQPMVTVDDVFNTMWVCFMAEEAVKTGRTVRIEYL